MKRQRSYFVFNKPSDYTRGWSDNLNILGNAIEVRDPARAGVFWSRVLDSREKEMLWHRLTLEGQSLGENAIRFDFYTSDQETVLCDGKIRILDRLIRDPAGTDREKRAASAPWHRHTAWDPRDILLTELKGRYLWFRVELVCQGGQSPRVGELKFRFPRESWLSYLPEIYQDPEGSSFTQRFLGIFQSLYDDLDEQIRSVARYLDPQAVGGEYLEWLAGWIDVEDGYLWPEEKLRELVRRGMELYRIRGTRAYVAEMVKLYTGQEPWVVEHSQVEPYAGDGARAALMEELYGGSPYLVTLVLPESALENGDAYKALLRIIDNARPAWVEVNLVVLTPYLFLDKYSYLGINSTLEGYQSLDLYGSAALPFACLGDGTEATL